MQKSGASRYVVLMPISLVRATANRACCPRDSRVYARSRGLLTLCSRLSPDATSSRE
jgi:hypothetical protein